MIRTARHLSLAGAALLALAPIGARAATYFTAAPPSGTANPITALSVYTTSGNTVSGATNYASQSVATSTGSVVTVPAGMAVTFVPSDATVAENNGLLIFTLPTGIQFLSAPTATIYNTTAGTTGTNTSTTNLPIVKVGAGSISSAGNRLVYVLTAGVAKKAITAVVQLGTFQIAGASVLSSPGGTIQITAQTSQFVSNAGVLNDTRPIEGVLATGASGVAGSMSQGPGDSIAIAAGAIATRFNATGLASAQGLTNGATVIGNVANLGTVTLQPSGAVDTGGTTALYSASATGTLVINGLFGGYSGAWLDPTSTCTTAGPPSGALVGTVSFNAITIAKVPLNGSAQAVCVTTQGTNLLSSTGVVTPTFTISGQTQVLSTVNPVALSYNGAAFRLTFVQNAGTSGTAQGYFRLTNTTTTTIPFFAVIQGDDFPVLSGQIATLGANQATLLSHDAVLRQLGATGSGFNAARRASALIFAPAAALGSSIFGYSNGNASGVSATVLQRTPTGLVSNID